MKKRLEKESSSNSGLGLNVQPRNQKKDCLLANANFKNQILNQSNQVKQQNNHSRTKSQSKTISTINSKVNHRV